MSAAPRKDAVCAQVQIEQKYVHLLPVHSEVTAVIDGDRQLVFTYYSDELTFTASEFEGLTVEAALKLYHDRDVAYLQSP